ncbi:hypothetical protein RB595_010058 [Gaeumannomyces hyphopodioides]
MASSSLYPEAQGDLASLLKEGERAKEYSVHLAHRYVNSPQTDLSQVIPRSVKTPQSELATIPTEAGPQDVVCGTTILQPRSDEGKGMALAPHTHEPHDVKEEEERFVALLEKYEQGAKGKDKTGIDPYGKHTIQELLAVVESAVDKYQNADTKGLWGKVRLAFRKLGGSGDVITGWLGLLPSETEYLSVVCGGLKLIIKAASRMKSVADKVLEALCDLPVLLSSTKRVLQCFPELRAHSDALYKSILVALGRMLAYLGRKSSLKRLFKAFFQQTSFEEDLVAKISDIRKQRDAFNDEADTCQKEMAKRVEEAADAARKSGEQISQGVQTMKEMVDVCLREQQRVKQQNDAIILAGTEMLRRQDSMRRRQDDMQRCQDEMQRQLEINRVLQQEILALLQANPRGIKMGVEAQSCQQSLEASPGKQKAGPSSTLADAHRLVKDAKLRRDWLLSQLDYDEDAPAEDLETNLRLVARMPADEQDRCLFIIKAEPLAAWVGSGESTALVIHGRSSHMERQRAGVSFVCARLIWSIGQLRAPTLMPLHFFCAQHQGAGPADVVNSLLAQLLARCSDDIDVAEARGLGGFRSDRLRPVWKRFKTVLDLLPPGVTVFCVVDSISVFVTDTRTASDAEDLIKKLLNLAQKRSKTKCVFKVLLTAPKRLASASLDDADVEEISVPVSLPRTGGLTMQKLKFGLENTIEELASSSSEEDSSDEE